MLFGAQASRLQIIPRSPAALYAALNLTSHLLALPSVRASPGFPNFDAGVTALQTLINKLTSAGQDIITMLWSHGDVVGTQAVLPSMLKSDREAKGVKGGVLRLVYQTALALQIGHSVIGENEILGDGMLADYDLEAGTVRLRPEVPAFLFGNDLDESALVAVLAKEMRPMSYGAMRSRLTRTAWAYTPAMFVNCEKDVALPVEKMEESRDARETCPAAFERVQRCQAGHAPFVIMPDWVVEVLRRAAGENL